MILLVVALPCLAQNEIPDGPGKAAVVKLCSNCHGLATVVGLRRTRSSWESTVDEMASRGATGTDDEFDSVVQYLTRYFGKVNMNKAASKEIQEVLEIPAEAADTIVHYRSQNGNFKDLAELEAVPGVDAKTIEARRDRIAFQ